MKKIIKNCSLYNKSGIFNIIINNFRIDEISQTQYDEFNFDEVIDIEKRLVIPGLIDTHIQGAGGYDILDNNYDGLKVISKTLAKYGVTSFLATTVIKPSINNEHLEKVNNFINDNEIIGAKCLGFHLEGPFININKKGGLNSDGICKPSQKVCSEIIDICNGNLKIMTLAPELEGNKEIIKTLIKNDIVPSIGHTEATYEETFESFCLGVKHCTHIFNAMPPLHHRNPGPIAAIINQQDVFAEVISDGYHLSPYIVRFLYNSLGYENTICITDGVQAIGLPEGKYKYNDVEYVSKDGIAKYLDGTLIGCSIGLLDIILRYKEFTGASLDEVVTTGSLNPAKILGIDKEYGSLEKGKYADFVILDYDFSVYQTYINGINVYTKEA